MKTLQPPAHRYRAAFTLLELLVVLAILAALIILSLSALPSLSERSKAVGCLQNLRQFGVGIFGYLNDHKGFPYHDGLPGSQSTGIGTTTPAFTQWLTEGGYLAKGETINHSALRCSHANESDRKRIYGMRYAGNSSFCIHFHKNPFSIPAPHSRVVLAAENYGNAFNIAGHLNRTIWANDDGTANPDTEGSAKQWPRPQYHGSANQRGLHLFFLDGHARLVVPKSNDWRLSPVFGDATNGGIIFDRDQFRRIKNGSLRLQ